MKLLIVAIILNSFLYAGIYDKITYKSLKFFKPSVIQKIETQYGKDGVQALEKLTSKYGKNSLNMFNDINNKFGIDGIKILAKYGDDIVLNKNSINMITKYKDKGFYIAKQYPTSISYYEKYGDKFMMIADKYGNKRVIKYLDESKAFNQDSKVLKFLDKFGDKANIFLDRHWGKLLTSGFVLLNADSFIASSENIAKKAIDKSGDVVTESVSNIANSQLGLFIGIALLLFVFFKYGLDKILSIKK